MASPKPPFISQKFLDFPTQRLYFLSFGLLCQAIKAVDIFNYLVNPERSSYSYCTKWLIVDLLYLLLLARLRIPRLDYAKSVVIMQIMSFWLADGILFGGISFNTGYGRAGLLPTLGYIYRDYATVTTVSLTLNTILSTLSFGLISLSDASDRHLLGQHTVRMSPISTAHLNPMGEHYCLRDPRPGRHGDKILVPLVMNNTDIVGVAYEILPLGYSDAEEDAHQPGKVERVELTLKELNTIERERIEMLAVPRTQGTKKAHEEEDAYEYDEDEEDETKSDPMSGLSLTRSQSLIHLPLSKPGILRLVRVLDSSGVDARLIIPTDVPVVPCPRAQFAVEDRKKASATMIKCQGEEKEVSFDMELYGVPPLSLRWWREVGKKREHFTVEGIEGHDEYTHGRKLDRKTVPQDIRIPLTATLNALGAHTYTLESITDGAGNTADAGSDQPDGGLATTGSSLARRDQYNASRDPVRDPRVTRSVHVLKRSLVSFENCRPGQPLKLLKNKSVDLQIRTRQQDFAENPWDVTVKYEPSVEEPEEPEEVDTSSNKAIATARKSSPSHQPWTRTFTMLGSWPEVSISTKEEGQYTLLGVKGQHCEGEVLEPQTCKVIEVPPPRIDIEWQKIKECSGDTGVTASLVFHGTPPFNVQYLIQRDGQKGRIQSQNYYSSMEQLVLRPEKSGHYTYWILTVGDKNYPAIEQDVPKVEQVVRPLASAEFVHTGETIRRLGKQMGAHKLSTCDAKEVTVPVRLKGTPPWNLEISTVSPKGTEVLKFPGITEEHTVLPIPIPKDVDKEGGTFDIDLASVVDSTGCKREMKGMGLYVEVHRVKPTARFYGKEGKRNVTVLENEAAALPLRMTGDGPWNIGYYHENNPRRILRKAIHRVNDELRVKEPGLYKLVAVEDSLCPGTVIPHEDVYQVNWIPRPSARLSSETEAIYEAFNRSYILPNICERVEDHVDLDLTGRPPFQLMYSVARDGFISSLKVTDESVLNSIQHHARFELQTSEAGRIYYEVKKVGDASYPLAKQSSVLPPDDRLLFEQEVMRRPSARFKNKNRMTYCLQDRLTPHDSPGTDGTVILEGTPPFQLTLTIKNLAASDVHTQTVEIPDRVWKLDLPSYSFRSIGPHLVTIEAIQDASHCQQALMDPQFLSLWIDVAETAAIIPYDRRDYFCVGETSRFTLEGTPPWSIGYSVNGKHHTQETKASPFSLVQQQPGEFVVTSVAHQNKMCKTFVTDLRYTVHDLPSAQVGHGNKIYQDIHEGDQAEIIFTLIGEPPFTFTYQRSEPASKKGGKPGKVLETHTVTGITTKEYSIFSALEGTWTVTFISDRYCRYPPAQISADAKRRP